MPRKERREGDAQRAEAKGGTKRELVGEDDRRSDVVDDLGQPCCDAVGLPEQVVEPSSGLKLERRHHPFACRGEKALQAGVVSVRLGRGIAARSSRSST